MSISPPKCVFHLTILMFPYFKGYVKQVIWSNKIAMFVPSFLAMLIVGLRYQGIAFSICKMGKSTSYFWDLEMEIILDLQKSCVIDTFLLRTLIHHYCNPGRGLYAFTLLTSLAVCYSYITPTASVQAMKLTSFLINSKRLADLQDYYGILSIQS